MSYFIDTFLEAIGTVDPKDLAEIFHRAGYKNSLEADQAGCIFTDQPAIRAEIDREIIEIWRHKPPYDQSGDVET